MALYAIGDLHLSLGTDKSMEVFGGRWEGYVDKLRESLSVITPDDTTVLMGDISWASDMDDAIQDLSFVAQIPGRKLLLKGNHDYWWTTAAKFYAACAENGWENMFLLHNNCHLYGDVAVCGTRGWFYEEDKQGTHDEKVFRRELGRLETSLKAAGDREKLCFLHYPPKYRGYECPEILQLLSQYGVKRCFYGHLHGDSHKLAVEGASGGLELRLLSADYLHFRPYRVL
ncbi:MAG: metallophosphoesterase [Oscillospiraceae bacterium]|nr:metallophosphoesterase [Oscillospiraceae bacterium]